MILYYFPIAQNTVNKTVSENFYRGVYACICMCTYFTIFLFTGLIPVYPLAGGRVTIVNTVKGV